METNKFLANSERGFYNIKGVTISDISPTAEDTYELIRNEKTDETLELLQIHIGEYADCEISDTGLEQISKTFEAYAEKEKRVSLIVRPLYDWDGKGMRAIPGLWTLFYAIWSRSVRLWRNMRVRSILFRVCL